MQKETAVKTIIWQELKQTFHRALCQQRTQLLRFNFTTFLSAGSYRTLFRCMLRGPWITPRARAPTTPVPTHEPHILEACRQKCQNEPTGAKCGQGANETPPLNRRGILVSWLFISVAFLRWGFVRMRFVNWAQLLREWERHSISVPTLNMLRESLTVWVSQGDFTLIQTAFHVLQQKFEKILIWRVGVVHWNWEIDNLKLLAKFRLVDLTTSYFKDFSIS